MDRMIFVAMTGAKHLLERQAVTAHNLANVSTVGYRAETHAFRSVQVESDTLPTRAFAIESTTGANFAPGTVYSTGREMDVAVNRGWIAVQLPDGGEAYTRNGNFQINEVGLLQTATGLNIAGETGPITVPTETKISIAADGTVSSVPTSSLRNQISQIGRIKLVNPDESELERGPDGLFRLKGGGVAAPDAGVQIASGFLEGSNVNAVEAMVDMIAVARQFEMQMKLLQTADGDARQAAQLFSVSR